MDAKGLTSWRGLYAGKALAIWIHIGGTQETRKGSPRLQDEGDSLHGLKRSSTSGPEGLALAAGSLTQSGEPQQKHALNYRWQNSPDPSNELLRELKQRGTQAECRRQQKKAPEEDHQRMEWSTHQHRAKEAGESGAKDASCRLPAGRLGIGGMLRG